MTTKGVVLIESMTTTSIDWNRIQAKWKDLKGRFKQEFGKLTEDDLTRIDGQKDRLVAKVQEYYGIQKDAALDRVDRFIEKL